MSKFLLNDRLMYTLICLLLLRLLYFDILNHRLLLCSNLDLLKDFDGLKENSRRKLENSNTNKNSLAPGLIFQTLTVAFGAMPGGQLFGTLFFILLIFAAWTSSISLIEPMIIWLIEKYNITRLRASIIAAGLAWVIGIGTIVSFNIGSDIKLFNMTIFELLDYLTSNILLPMGGIMITVFVGWLLSKENIDSELQIKSKILRSSWYFSAKIIAPIAVIIVMLNALGFNINIFM